jgi:predicted DNA-binding protein YlxM (UPF0122 family)
MGFPRDSKDLQIEDIEKLWNEGLSISEIAAELSCTYQNIYKRMKKEGIYDSAEAKRRGKIHQRKVMSDLRKKSNPAKRPEVRTRIMETVKHLWKKGVYADVPRKLSIKMKERFQNEEERVKISNVMKERLKNKEIRRKWSEVQLRRFSNSTERQKFSEFAKKMWANPETREKIIKSLKERYKDDLELRFGRNLLRGENHWNWKGGKSLEKYPAEFSEEIKERVRIRDKYTCRICGIKQDELPRKLDVHHINGDKRDNCAENLISLCFVCHALLEKGEIAKWILGLKKVTQS